MNMRMRFCSSPLLNKVTSSERNATFTALESNYGEQGRFYHTLAHIESCLEVFDRFKHVAKKPRVLEMAIFYHDLIYEMDAAPRENEEASAFAAVGIMASWECRKSDVLSTMSAILATTHDHEPSESDNKFIVDIDLAGLGAPWEVFLKNHENVRKEYSRYSDEEFRAGNGKVLKRFLDRTPLYYHREIEAAYGRQAKKNLTRWLNR